MQTEQGPGTGCVCLSTVVIGKQQEMGARLCTSLCNSNRQTEERPGARVGKYVYSSNR